MTSTSNNGEVFEGTTVVDTDVHLSIPFDELAEYCDEPYRSITKNPTYTPVHRGGWNRYMGEKIESQKKNVQTADALYGKNLRRVRYRSPAYQCLSSVKLSSGR